ncbi:MAG: type II toxin-antitoxin system VapC family toxin [Candidatus Rokubacteria bacterium]|nr:type II toxin-antitoxin system VapC family toxin [Candidatus Rokubacteria bacterium]
MACLDTSLLIDASGRAGRARRDRARRAVEHMLAEGEPLSTTRFTVAELWVGVERSEDRARELAAIDALLAPLAILDFDDPAARMFGRIVAHMHRSGTPRGDMDMLIAAVALTHGERLVTNNVKHFAGIPGLAVETC